MFQNPGEKPGTAPVLRGLKGTGKGIFVVPLYQIWGIHSVKVNNLKHLTGNFNSHMDAKILVVSEESSWGGDKAADSVIKDMITSDTMLLEKKFMDAVEIRDRRHFIIVSNAENVIRVTPDERRYAVTVVTDERKGDKAYFDNLAAQIGGGTIAPAMLHDLLNLEIKVDLRRPPRTDALVQQILTNLPAEDRWLRTVLETGTFPDADGDSGLTDTTRAAWEKGPVEVSPETVYASYRSMVKAYNGKEVATSQIGKFFVGAFRARDGEESLISVPGNGMVGRTYRLPPLPELRNFYTGEFGLPLNEETIENDDDFIRLTNPEFAKAPTTPDAAASEEEQKAYKKAYKAYEVERKEMWEKADAYINEFFGRNSNE